MTTNTLEYNVVKPHRQLADMVESYWMLKNNSDERKEIIILPDGRIDLSFSYSATEPFDIRLMGLSSRADVTYLPPRVIIFAISFKLLALEYVLNTRAASILNETLQLPDNYWGISQRDLNSLEDCARIAEATIQKLLIKDVDSRKRKLFQLIYSTNGSLSVQQLSDEVSWSARQINRYFNDRFGISLKAYCSVLRFRASFESIKEGKLFPEQDFVDQPHFIKEVKKLSGVNPRELFLNKNDRFIQFSTLKPE